MSDECVNCKLLMERIVEMHTRLELIVSIAHLMDVRYPIEQDQRIRQEFDKLEKKEYGIGG